MSRNQTQWDHSGGDQEAVTQFCRALADALAGQAAPREEAPVQTIHLMGLVYRILENLKYVVVTAIALAVLGGCYGQYFVIPSYSATAKLYILGQADSAINLSALQIGTVLTMDYQEVFKTWEVHEMVRQELDLHYSYSQLQSMVTVTNPEDTRILYITVSHPDGTMAADIANAYAKAAKRFILETMDGEAPNSFSVALTPGSPDSLGKSTYIAIGFLLGTLVSLLVITLQFVFDDRPGGPEDVEEACGLPILAVIPEKKIPRHRPGPAKDRKP